MSKSWDSFAAPRGGGGATRGAGPVGDGGRGGSRGFKPKGDGGKDQLIPRADQTVYKPSTPRPTARQVEAMKRQLGVGAPVKGTKFKPNPTRDKGINYENFKIAKANAHPEAADIMERKGNLRVAPGSRSVRQPNGSYKIVKNPWNRGSEGLTDDQLATGSSSKTRRLEARDRALKKAYEARKGREFFDAATKRNAIKKANRIASTSAGFTA